MSGDQHCFRYEQAIVDPLVLGNQGSLQLPRQLHAKKTHVANDHGEEHVKIFGGYAGVGSRPYQVPFTGSACIEQGRKRADDFQYNNVRYTVRFWSPWIRYLSHSSAPEE